jgi:hypothetical protein
VYLLLDFLSLLLTTLLSDNPEVKLDQFVRQYARGHRQDTGGGGGSPTSGAEEVDRILTEARRRYGRIRPTSFRQNIDSQNISAIAKPPEVSEVDKAQPTFRLPSLRQKRPIRGGVEKKKSVAVTSSSQEGGVVKQGNPHIFETEFLFNTRYPVYLIFNGLPTLFVLYTSINYRYSVPKEVQSQNSQFDICDCIDCMLLMIFSQVFCG